MLDAALACFILSGQIDEVVLHAEMVKLQNVDSFVKHRAYINGLQSHTASLRSHVNIDSVPGLNWKRHTDHAQSISFHRFPPGSVLVIR